MLRLTVLSKWLTSIETIDGVDMPSYRPEIATFPGIMGMSDEIAPMDQADIAPSPNLALFWVLCDEAVADAIEADNRFFVLEEVPYGN